MTIPIWVLWTLGIVVGLAVLVLLLFFALLGWLAFRGGLFEPPRW